MSNFFLGLKFSFSYFSILPIKFKDDVDLSKKEILSFMILFLPFVGMIISSLAILLFLLLSELSYVGAIIAAVFYMFLYGFLHTEAIFDVVDAIYAKHSGKDAYKVIKEPTVGALGVIYAVCLILTKVALISYLLLNEHYALFILIATISRVSLVYSIKLFEFKSSFVTTLKESINNKSLTILFIFYALFLFLFNTYSVLISLFIGFLFVYFFMNFLKNSLGFLNGDTLGITLEFNEIIIALSFLLLV